jgi:DNA-binding CsgD family transcriptional regulator
VQLLERELAEPGLSPEVEAGLQLELAKALRAGGRGRDAVLAAEAAYRAVRSAAPSLVVARAHAAYAATLMMTGQYRQVDPVVKDALAVLDALDAVPDGDVATVRSNVLNTSGVSRALLGDLDDGVALLRESVELARHVDSAEDVCRGLTNLAFVFENAGMFDESVTESLRCIEEARARGVEISAAGLAVCNVLESLVWLGRWEEAEQLAESAAQRPFSDEVLASIHHSAAQLALGRGNLAAAHDHIAVAERAAAGAEAPQLHAQLGGLRAEVALADHDPETALRIVDETLATSAGNDDDAHLLHLVTVGLQALNDLRRRPPSLRTLGLPAIVDRADTLHGLIPSADPVPAADAGSVDAPDPVPGTDPDPAAGAPPLHSAEIALAGLEYDRLQDADAAADWRTNAAAWHGLREPWLVAHAHFREAEARLRADRSDRKGAAEALDRAIDSLSGLGRPVLLGDDIEALRRRARLEPAAPTPSAQPDAADRLRLTAREREVLAMLTEGLTNRRIARALYMTEKTASVHVSHILSKLHVSTRGEAAAAARRLGLVPDRGTE